MAEVIDKTADFLSSAGALLQGSQLKIVSSVFGKKEPPRSAGRELQDRNETITATEAPHVYIYGRARVGSAIVAVLTSGDKDQFKHIVCVHAAHECDAIEEVYINGVALGTLDGNGNVTSGIFYKSSNQGYFEFITGGTGKTLAYTPNPGSFRIFAGLGSGGTWGKVEVINYTLIGNVVSGLTSGDYHMIYMFGEYSSYVRVSKHLGTYGQAADALTISEVPTKWDLTKHLYGMTYTIVRIDLNYRDFQGGCPTVEVLLRGKKLHDPRAGGYPNDTPIWSQNNALVIADYLSSELCAVPISDLPLADYIAAANVCDESISIGKRYTFNGTINADESQRDVLNKMAQSMAGTIVGVTWGITAGKYVAPVMAISQSDIVGSLSYTAGTPEADLFNGVKGQYISAANNYVSTDFGPYQNAAYVTADGGELWTDIDFQYTDDKQRVHNLARIYTEDQRNGFTIQAEFSYKAWALQVGQRVTFTSSFMGQTGKVYRVMDKSYSIDTAVKLTIKEDVAEIWDLADAVSTDATPNTGLPSPFIVPIPGNLQAVEELYETTGSSGVKVKVIVTWNAPNDANVMDYEIQYKAYSDVQFIHKYYSVNTQVEIFDIASGKFDFRVRARNHLNLYSDYTNIKTIDIFGLITPPGNVLNFTVKPFNNSALCLWDKTVDLDVKIGGDVEIRFCPFIIGASWEQSIVLPDGKFNGDATSAIVSLGTGTYYAKFKDSTGNYSATPASFIATEALVTGWTTVQTSTQHTAFSGTKTACVATDSILKLSSSLLVDDFGLIDSLGYIDSEGGIALSGTYEFDATMDLTTQASRRFIAYIKSISYNANDTFDSRLTLIDIWEDFDGGVINGTNATCYASVSNDNVIYSDWVPFLVSDFNCRYAKFKLVLTNTDPVNNINIQELTVTAKVPA